MHPMRTLHIRPCSPLPSIPNQVNTPPHPPPPPHPTTTTKKAMANQGQEHDATPQQPPAAPAPAPVVMVWSPFEALPEFAHTALVALLKDKQENVLHLSLGSRALLDLYGGSLTSLRVNKPEGPDHRDEALTALVERNSGLRRVVVGGLAAIPAVVDVIARGHFRHLRELTVMKLHDYLSFKDKLANLAAAMQVPGALQALECLRLERHAIQPEVLPLLAGALAGGAAPNLRLLDLGGGALIDEDAEALAAMLEARAQRPACRRLEMLKAEGLLDEEIEEAPRCRVVRALLPTILELEHLVYDTVYDACFVAAATAQPCPLTKLRTYSTGLPSAEALAALPALEHLAYNSSKEDDFVDLEEIRSLVSALKDGVALQRLQKLEAPDLHMDPDEWGVFLGALAGAPCAAHLTSLDLRGADLSEEDSCTCLSDFLGQDRWPLLKELTLSDTYIDDDGAAIVAKGLMAASIMRLTHLHVDEASVLGDGWVEAVAGLVGAGRFERLEVLSINVTEDTTDEGACALAHAIKDAGEHGLPLLSRFEATELHEVTEVGVKALVSALIDHCPRLTLVDLSGRCDRTPEEQAMVDEMVRAADCRYRLTVKVLPASARAEHAWGEEGGHDHNFDADDDADEEDSSWAAYDSDAYEFDEAFFQDDDEEG